MLNEIYCARHCSHMMCRIEEKKQHTYNKICTEWDPKQPCRVWFLCVSEWMSEWVWNLWWDRKIHFHRMPKPKLTTCSKEEEKTHTPSYYIFHTLLKTKTNKTKLECRFFTFNDRIVLHQKKFILETHTRCGLPCVRYGYAKFTIYHKGYM